MWVPDELDCIFPEKVCSIHGRDIEVIHGMKADYYHILDTWYIKISSNGVHDSDQSAGYGSDKTDYDFSKDGEALSSIQLICTNDVRLSYIGNFTAGTKVSDFDDDQNKLIASPALASFPGNGVDTTKIRYFDANGNAIYDHPDDVYLNVPTGASPGLVAVNNVRLSGPIP
jgi:hypothetical protein